MFPPSSHYPRRVPLTRIGPRLWGSYRALDKLSIDVPAEMLASQCRRRQCSSLSVGGCVLAVNLVS